MKWLAAHKSQRELETDKIGNESKNDKSALPLPVHE